MNEKLKTVVAQCEKRASYEIELAKNDTAICRDCIINSLYDDPVFAIGGEAICEAMKYAGYSAAYVDSVYNMDARGCQYIDRLNEAFKRTETYKTITKYKFNN